MDGDALLQGHIIEWMVAGRKKEKRGNRPEKGGGGASLRGSQESKSREEKTEDLRYIRGVFFAHFC